MAPTPLFGRVLVSCLRPVSWLYALVGVLSHRFSKPEKVGVPVICVGNVVVGGAGKTPFVLWLANHLKNNGHSPHILLRGYGGSHSKSNHRVTLTDTVELVGDEALLYVDKFPTWVGGDRVKSAQLAQDAGADIILMDDGFQNHGLTKDLSFLIVDRQVGFGNGLVLPAGPLREPLNAAFKRTQHIVVMGNEKLPLPQNLPVSVKVYEARVELRDEDVAWLKNKNLIAFSGIGRPEKFFDSLKNVGANLLAVRSFPDHHVFTEQELQDLQNLKIELEAQYGQVTLVTTSKDHLRLSKVHQQGVKLVRVDLRPKDEFKILNVIDQLVKSTIA
ncbi:MAG: tetraacyldisaccharide 4'-kinase [Alphaproteobacteria bacterium]